MLFLPPAAATAWLLLACLKRVLVHLHSVPWKPKKHGVAVYIKNYGLVSVILFNPFQISDYIDGLANCSFVSKATAEKSAPSPKAKATSLVN